MENNNIEDLDAIERQIRDCQTSITYDTKEYVVEVMVKRFEKGLFYIPEYQREFVWDEKKQSKFIESIIMGLPIPFLFGVHDKDANTEILDGAQRINTLNDFYNNKLALEGLERLDLLNDLKFKDLPLAQQNRFIDRSVRMIILPDTVSIQSRLDMFERINTGSELLRKAEIRKGAFSGPFYDFVTALASNEQFKRLCPVPEKVAKRGEREELVLRFFAYSEKYLDFKHSVFNFLDQYLVDKNKNGFNEKELTANFYNTLNYVERNIPTGFAKTAKSKTTPRVRFEAISIGINLALKEQPALDNKGAKFLEHKDFHHNVTTHASNSGPKLKRRIEFVKNWLLEV